MADASCSGGTPFKRLVDHQARDVSHHQDRLVDRTGAQSHSSFRSTPQANQGQNGFGAFMEGPSALPGMSHHDHHAAGRLAAHAAALNPSQAPAFAPGQAPQFQTRPAPAVDVSNWAADFSRFSGPQQQQPRQPMQNAFQQPATQMNMNQPAQFNFQAAFAQPNTFSPLYGPTNGGFVDANAAAAQRPAAEAEFDQEMTRWMSSHGNGGGMEEVDAVMDQMARELELNEAVLANGETATEHETTATTETRLDGPSHFTDLETPEIGNLSLGSNETLAPEEVEAAKTKSEVSEAAERLLESVQHEDGEKWKNSVFLSLMRDFRDGRKDIVDNEIRETPENETDASDTDQSLDHILKAKRGPGHREIR
ncbi:Fc.00g061470.m01.CDS01 [Cosmosporella sp. VM-42]